MIKPLRKRHLQIWSLWALLLPLLIVAATVVRRPVAKDAFAPVQNGKTLPVLIAEKQLGQNQLQLRGSNANNIQQLLWANREPLAVASATIYLANPEAATINGAAYIGRIETRGNYVFALPPQKEYHFIVYDFIHQQVINHISFNETDIAQQKKTAQNTPTPNAKHQTQNY
jgi:hypothetical protein